MGEIALPRKAMEVLTESMFYVLLALKQGEMCGIEITDSLKDFKGRVQLGPATLYTILAKFEKENISRETAVDGRKRTAPLPARFKAFNAGERLRQCAQTLKCRAEGGWTNNRTYKGQTYRLAPTLPMIWRAWKAGSPIWLKNSGQGQLTGIANLNTYAPPIYRLEAAQKSTSSGRKMEETRP